MMEQIIVKALLISVLTIGPQSEDVHTIEYVSGANHPQWAGVPCKVLAEDTDFREFVANKLGRIRDDMKAKGLKPVGFWSTCQQVPVMLQDGLDKLKTTEKGA